MPLLPPSHGTLAATTENPHMEDVSDLSFLAQKSKEIIEKQVASFREQHTKASSIVAIIAIFVPLFLNGLNDALTYIKIFSVIPIALFLISLVILLLFVFMSEPVGQFFDYNYLIDLAERRDHKNALAHEIGANERAFYDNKKILRSRSKKFNLSVTLTTIAIVFSVFLLILNSFKKEGKKIYDINVTNKLPVGNTIIRDTVWIEKKVPVRKVIRKKCCSSKIINNVENQYIENQTSN